MSAVGAKQRDGHALFDDSPPALLSLTTLTIDDRDAKSLSLNWHAGLVGGAVAAMHDDAADVDPVGRDHHLAG